MDIEVNTIKGIKNFYIFNYGNQTFYLFGDIHKQVYACSDQTICDYMTPDLNNIIINPSSSCISITALFYEWFHYNNKYNIVTDFFIESPIPHTYNDVNEKLNIITTDINNNGNISYNKNGFMYDTLIMLKKCLTKNKSNCIYNPNIRMHYSDIRNIIKNNNIYQSTPFILDEIYYIFRYMSNIIVEKYNTGKDITNIITNIKYSLIDFINIINFLIRHALVIFKATVSNDINNLNMIIDKIPGKTKIKDKIIILFENMKLLSKFRNNKNVHYLSSQLSRLNKNIASHIINFSTNKIQEYIKILQDKDNVNSVQVPIVLLKLWIESIDSGVEDAVLIENLLNNVLPTLNTIINDKLILLSGIYIEAYTLARMLKYNDSKEIILNMGSQHITNIIDFFRSYLNVTDIYGVDNNYDNLCINVVNLENYIPISKFRENLLF
jgi:hypothetical protein